MKFGVAPRVQPGGGVEEVTNQPVDIVRVRLDYRPSALSSRMELGELLAHAGVIGFAHVSEVEARVGRDLQICRR
jgi:hypothetical protein